MKLTRSIITGATMLALAVTVHAQDSMKKDADMKGEKAPMKVTKAIAVLHSTEGNSVTGTIRFEHTGEGIHVTGEVKGLTPGKHGFHVHEFGDCSAPDATSAGGHFNPTNEAHGAPKAEAHHIGDMGNVEADASGVAKVDMTLQFLSFDGPTSILGRGLIVHAGADDLKSQPTGDAGARVACAVIGVANTK